MMMQRSFRQIRRKLTTVSEESTVSESDVSSYMYGCNHVMRLRNVMGVFMHLKTVRTICESMQKGTLFDLKQNANCVLDFCLVQDYPMFQ